MGGGVLFLILFTSACAQRQLKNSNALEGLYLNTSDGCKEFLNKHPQSVCQEYKNMTALLTTTAHEAVKQCRHAFQYALWPCVIDQRTFNKVTRERVFLTSLYAAFLTLNGAKWCSLGYFANCSKSDRKPAFHLEFGSHLAKTYLYSETNGVEDPIGSVISHSINLGVSVVQRSVEEMCKCHGISGSCGMKTCWLVLPSSTRITLELKRCYEDTIQWDSNSLWPAKELKKLKNKLVYLDESIDYCNETKNRRCNNEENCFYICCGKQYFPVEVDYNKYRCNCTWKVNFSLGCEICTSKIQWYTCG